MLLYGRPKSKERSEPRHGSGLFEGQGHAAWYKYNYMCLNTPAKAADPGAPDISWSADGHVVP